jgi:DNA-binding winged helix-turn-helix (wHTH) protein
LSLPVETYRFASFTLNAATRQLLRGQQEVPLSPKAFQLLRLLVTNGDRAMSKQELHESLWPSTFVVETNLASLIAEIRRALDDDAAKPRFVRTIYRFGYRFVGEAEASSTGPISPVSTARHWLIWEAGQAPLADGHNTIGRGPNASVWIDLPGISREHARIVVAGNDARIEDLGSKNGTYVAGEAVTTPRRLVDGDQIRLGPIVVTFRVPSLSAVTETAT